MSAGGSRCTLANLYSTALQLCAVCFDVRAQVIDSHHRVFRQSMVGVALIESPVRRQWGAVVPFEEMQAIVAACRARGVQNCHRHALL